MNREVKYETAKLQWIKLIEDISKAFFKTETQKHFTEREIKNNYVRNQ